MTSHVLDVVPLLLPFLFEEEKVPLLLSNPVVCTTYQQELQEIKECAQLLAFWEARFYWDDLARYESIYLPDYDDQDYFSTAFFPSPDSVISD